MDTRTVGDVINQMPVQMRDRLYLMLGIIQDESTTVSTVSACLAYLIGPLTKNPTDGSDADAYLKAIAYVIKEVILESCSDERRKALLRDELVSAVVNMVKTKSTDTCENEEE